MGIFFGSLLVELLVQINSEVYSANIYNANDIINIADNYEDLKNNTSLTLDIWRNTHDWS